MDNLVEYYGNQGNGYICVGNVYFKFGSVKSIRAGAVQVLEVPSPKFKSILYCDAKSDYATTYPEDKPSFDYYGGTSGNIYVPKSLPIGNTIYYIIIGTI